MNCPRCDSADTETLETRKVAGGTVDRRRHLCRRCAGRWTSRTEIEADSFAGPPFETGNATGSADATGSVRQNSPDATGSVQPPTGSVGGVGGGLSSGSGSGSDPDPSSGRSRSPSGARARWASEDWKRHFGRFWADAKGRMAYGFGSIADSRAVGDLGDILGSLSDDEALKVERAAPDLFRRYLAEGGDVGKANHPWSWFVVRFNGMLTDALKANGKPVSGFVPSDLPEE